MGRGKGGREIKGMGGHHALSLCPLTARSPRARLSALKPICGQQNPAGEGVIMLNFMNRSIFEISVGSLKLQDATKFTTKIVFGTMKLRYSASTTLNLSWEVAFFMKFSVAMTDFYTVIFKT